MSRRGLLAVALTPLLAACDTAVRGNVNLNFVEPRGTPGASFTRGDVERIVATSIAEVKSGATPAVLAATVTPGARAAAVATEAKSGSMVVDHEMKRGERYVTTDEGFVVGDVFVSHPETGELRRMFDDNENSGLIVKFLKGTTIEAPFGADVPMTGTDEKVKEQMMGQAQKDMEDKGCEFSKNGGKGCAWVYITTSRGTPQSQVPFGTK